VIQWPAPEKLTKIAAGILERFKKTSAAKELEQDTREWSFISWAWLPEPPYALTLRCADLEERYFLLEGDGRWQMRVIRPARSVA
jgi:hypothetical protein